MLVKKIWAKEKFFPEKNVGPKEILGPKRIVGPKKFWFQTISCHRKKYPVTRKIYCHKKKCTVIGRNFF